MNWTPEQIITLAGIIFGFISTIVLTVGGWVVVGKLNKANTDKAKAETEQIYQDIAHQSAERERKMNERILELEGEISRLKQMNVNKDKENSNLRREFAELKVQYDAQSIELDELKKEVQALRLKRK